MIFENEFFQLLEYTPLTAKVHERPILFVPPCINKFYILDLQPENSLIRHTVAEGHRVFVMSWKNAGEEIAQRTWDDYIERRRPARDRASCREITGQEQINTLGFCIGGTILATALAVLERARRAAGGEHDAADDLPRLQRDRHPRHLRRRGLGAHARDDHRRAERRRRQPAQGPGAGDDLQLPAPERPGLELRRRQLPEGRDAAAVRPAVLEQRRHQPARADVLLVPAQHLPREQPRQAGQG